MFGYLLRNWVVFLLLTNAFKRSEEDNLFVLSKTCLNIF